MAANADQANCIPLLRFHHELPEDLVPAMLDPMYNGWFNVSWSAPGGNYRIYRFTAGGEYKRWSSLAEKTVAAATERMKRRWMDEFLETRGEVVSPYQDRSVYLRMDADVGGIAEGGANVGTFGLTYGQFNRESLKQISSERIPENTSFNLPEEKTLGIALPRFTDEDGDGIAIELRTFSKDKNAVLTLTEQKVLLVEGIATALQTLKRYPDLWDKPIIHTYGDRTSLKLYGGVYHPETGEIDDGLLNLGFRRVPGLSTPEKGITAYGVEWWPMWVTPRRLQQFLDQSDYKAFYDRMKKPEVLDSYMRNFIRGKYSPDKNLKQPRVVEPKNPKNQNQK